MRFLALITYAALASATYNIQDDYKTSAFASMFDFFTGADPTNGYVNYVDQGAAQSQGLLKVQNNQVYMGVDNTNVASGRGRDSIRVSSKNTYNHGLFILDLEHMPGGQCGTWPAFWLLGPNWPTSGELDIIEGVNSQKSNGMALHTNAGCSITNKGQYSGQLEYANCDVNAANQPGNTGCAIAAMNDQSYGTGFNAAGGGVYATEWTSEHISIWFFPRSAIPADITSGSPNPSNWGLPTSSFSGACDLDQHVKNQQIVFDITFCGSWAGEVWSQDTTCGSKAATCQGFVQNNPTAFQETFWQINSLKVYQDNGANATSTSASASSSATVTTTAAQTSLSTFTTTYLSSATTTQATTSAASYYSSWGWTATATTISSVYTTETYTTTTVSVTPSVPVSTAASSTQWATWPGQSNSWGSDHNGNGWGGNSGWGGGRWNGGGGGGRRRIV